jgi:hypothetical protein
MNEQERFFRDLLSGVEAMRSEARVIQFRAEALEKIANETERYVLDHVKALGIDLSKEED